MKAEAKSTVIDVCTWQPPPYAAQAQEYFAGKPLRLGAGTHLLAHSALIEDRRAYWTNNNFTSNVTDDIPHESRLEPAEWGWATVE